MSQVLQKASFSPIIYDMVDYSNAIFDPDVELIGQTANCPVHIAAMHFGARASLERFPLDALHPGDIVVLNDPYQGGTHTPDVTMTMPIFHDDELLAIAVSRAHWTDVGGNLDTHIGGEGLRLPPLMLYQRRQAQRRARRDHQELHAHAAVRRGRHPGADRRSARRPRRDAAASGQVRR